MKIKRKDGYYMRIGNDFFVQPVMSKRVEPVEDNKNIALKTEQTTKNNSNQQSTLSQVGANQSYSTYNKNAMKQNTENASTIDIQV